MKYFKMLPLEKMFDKERDFKNLKLGCKATVFDKDPNNIILR